MKIGKISTKPFNQIIKMCIDYFLKLRQRIFIRFYTLDYRSDLIKNFGLTVRSIRMDIIGLTKLLQCIKFSRQSFSYPVTCFFACSFSFFIYMLFLIRKFYSHSVSILCQRFNFGIKMLYGHFSFSKNRS